MSAAVLIATAVRARGIRAPGGMIFDEFYAADACHYLGRAAAQCRTDVEITAVQPPLGKWLLAGGIRAAGFGPLGWRLAPLIAGVLTVAVVFLLGRALTSSTLVAGVASGLVAVDPLHIVFSRTAMLDVFVTLFGTAAVLFAVYDLDGLAAGRTTARRGWSAFVISRRWRVLAGVALGCAGATKWSGWCITPVLLVLAVAAERRATAVEPARATPRRSIAVTALALVLVPVALYVASYAGRLEGSLAVAPWGGDSWVGAFIDRQQDMLSFHLHLSSAHPYSSPAWSWPLLRRPVVLYFAESAGRYREVLAVGNPAVWWPALAALGWSAWSTLVRRPVRIDAAIVAGGFAAVYLPWLLIGTRDQTFLYYFLPAVPFMALAIAVTIARAAPRHGAVMAGVALLAGIVFVTAWYPVLTGRPIDPDAWERRMLFQSCVSQDEPRPVTQAGPPPPGWCWI